MGTGHPSLAELTGSRDGALRFSSGRKTSVPPFPPPLTAQFSWGEPRWGRVVAGHPSLEKQPLSWSPALRPVTL